MRVKAACLVVAMFVLLPSAAHAQASITGIVKDSSGAVLPGVTVEASSPALIEKVRTATTDGNGQYRIVDLRAGEYTVTFTLSGFSDRQARGRHPRRVVHRDHQHRHARWRAHRDHHRHRRVADRRRAEHQTPDGARQRHHQRDSVLAVLQQPDSADSEQRQPGWSADRRAGRAGHGGVWRLRRAVQRGPRQRGRPQRRLGLQRRGRVVLHRRCRQRA